MVSLDCFVVKNCQERHLKERTFWYLQGINVSGINISDCGLESISNPFALFPNLETIDISKNPELKRYTVTSVFTPLSLEQNKIPTAVNSLRVGVTI